MAPARVSTFRWLALAATTLPGLACQTSAPVGAGVGGSMAEAGGAPSSAGTAARGGSPPLEACTTEADASPLVLRRLTATEYELSLQELFGLAAPPDIGDVPRDGEQEGFRTIAALQSLSDQHLRAYGEIAARLGEELLADESRRGSVLGCEPAAAQCLEGFVGRFGKLAYRRPLSAVEVDDLVARARASAGDERDRFLYVMEALLTSASFLFRVEVGRAGAAGGAAELEPLELASRLAFTVWGRSPSAELLTQAEQGALSTPEGLRSAAAAMLADPRASVFFKAFFKQWLDFEELRSPTVPPPGWDDALLPQMIQETEALLQDFAWTPGVRLTDALTANYTYVTPALGAFYGLTSSGVAGQLQKVTFPADHPRAGTGLLTHAALISAKSDADLISYRGKWLRGAFLCQKLEVPSGLLADVASELAGLTYVQVIEKRNAQQPCAGCHALIDPLGVGLAQYDSAGHYDPRVEPSEFGLTPRFEGAQNPDFRSVAELSAELAKMPGVASCMAEKAFIYTQGRFPGEQDRCALEAIGQRFASSGYAFPALVTSLIESPSFRMRRAPQ